MQSEREIRNLLEANIHWLMNDGQRHMSWRIFHLKQEGDLQLLKKELYTLSNTSREHRFKA